jgi:hypothetical protein
MWGPQYANHYNTLYPGYDLPNDWKGLLDYDEFSSRTICNEGNKPKDAECWTDKGLDGKINKYDDVPLFDGDLGNNVGDALRANIARQGLSDEGGVYGYIYVAVYDGYDDDEGEIHVSQFAKLKVYYDDVDSSSAPGTFVAFGLPSGIPEAASGPGAPRVARLVPPNTALPVYPTPTPSGSPSPSPSPSATTTPVPSATPSCDVTVSGPSFVGEAKNASKFDVSMSWATDVPVSYAFAWGGAPGSLSNIASGGPGTSGSASRNNQNNGTYYWQLTITKSGCSAVQSSGSYSYP